MKITTLGREELQEVPWGVYLWKMPNGSFVGDGEGHFLMIPSMRGDNERMKLLAEAARECGVEEGMPCFFQGNRVVNDEEYERQKARMKLGLVPDPLDVAAIEEERRYARNRRR
jgi:hypothetical protein